VVVERGVCGFEFCFGSASDAGPALFHSSALESSSDNDEAHAYDEYLLLKFKLPLRSQHDECQDRCGCEKGVEAAHGRLACSSEGQRQRWCRSAVERTRAGWCAGSGSGRTREAGTSGVGTKVEPKRKRERIHLRARAAEGVGRGKGVRLEGARN